MDFSSATFQEKEYNYSFANGERENLDYLLADDPGWKATQSLYIDFHDAVRQLNGQAQALALVQRFEQICSDQYLLLKKLIERVPPSQRKKFLLTAETAEIVARELRTWKLLCVLYEDRFSFQPGLEPGDDANDQMEPSSSRCLSDKEVEATLHRKHRLYRELKILKQWTEQTTYDSVATCDTSIFSEKCVLWENSLHLLKTGQKFKGKKLISSFEPDATLQPGVHLDDCDANDEAALLRLVFEFLRTGQKKKAIDVCVHVGQSWRAAMLCGGELSHDPNLAHHHSGNSQMSLGSELDELPLFPNGGGETDAGDDDLVPLEGQANRELWKKICWQIVENSSLPKFERAVMGTLSGHLASLFPVCSTWTDYVWAYSLCGAEYQISSALSTYRHPLHQDWQPFVRDEDADKANAHYASAKENGDPTVTQCDFTLEEMFSEIDARRSGQKLDDIAEVFHDAQRYGIEENFNIAITKHLQYYHDTVSSGGYRGFASHIIVDANQTPDTSVPLHIMRFMAHYALIVRMFGVDANEFLVNNVLELYVKALIEDQRVDLVAEYCSHLPRQLHVQLFASMCESICDPLRRQELLYSASDAALDVPEICRTVVCNKRKAYCDALGDILNTDLSILIGRSTGGLGNISFGGSPDLNRTSIMRGGMETSILDSTMAGSSLMGEGMKSNIEIVRKMVGDSAISEADREVINSIQWLLFDPALRMDAIKEANALARTFLMMRNFKCARLLIEDLPKDYPLQAETLSSLQFEESEQLSGDDLNALHELMCMKTYLEALAEFNLWYDRFYHQRPLKPVGHAAGGTFRGHNTGTPETPGASSSVTPGIRRSSRRSVASSNSATGGVSRSNEVAFKEKLVQEQEMKTYESAKCVWEADVTMFAETAVAHLYEVLTYKGVGWMVNHVDVPVDESRSRELAFLRTQCLPLAASMILAIHSTMDQPDQVLQLADVVADEKNALYEVFNKGELQNLLDGFAKNALKTMDS